MRVSIFGMGYVGVVSGACLARLGHDVIGVDINPTKVELLKAGRAPIVEKGIDELVAQMTAAGRLRATADAAEAVAHSDIAFISVGTPSDRTGATALGGIDAVTQQIGHALRNKKRDRPFTVVMRSTVPPGTMEERLAPALCDIAGLPIGEGLELCSNPEFLREGSAIADFERPVFTLVGCASEIGFAVLREIYRGIDAPVIRTGIRIAEGAKYLCNMFHAVKIGFANEVGSLLKSLGIDSREAMRILCEDRVLNISPAYLRPGFAFGGSCLPKDLRAFLALAESRNIDLPFIGNLLASNERHIDRAFRMITEGGRRKIALFGLAFKPGTDDLRESPLVALAERLIGKGYELAVYDRYIEVARLIGANREFIDREVPHLERLLKPTPDAALENAGVIVLGHAGETEIATIAANHRGRTIVDLQGIKDLEGLDGADYQGICW